MTWITTYIDRMATKVLTQITDDLDGSDDASTIAFSVDGVTYEIDLSERNAKKLHAAVRPYVEAGRRVAGRTRAGRRRPSLADARGFSTAKIREWAKSNGVQIGEKGRIPNEIMENYAAAMANGGGAPDKAPAKAAPAAKKAPAKKAAATAES